ncbi:MAG: Calx-beta domain-containing protein, partial [Arenimonas sp.]
EVTLANHGPEIATDVTVNLALHFLTPDFTPEVEGATCSRSNDWEPWVSCRFDALAPNEVRVFEVQIRIPSDSWPVEASAITTIQGGGRETDPVPGNNTFNFVLPSLRVHPVTVSEGNSGTRQMVFTISLSRPVSWPVTFDLVETPVYETIPATVGEDYVAFASTGLTIPAGQLAKTLAVTVKGDTTVEPNEVVALRAVNVVGAYREISTGVGTIANDEGAVVTVAPASRPEADGYVEFTAILSQALAEDVSFVARSARTPWSTAAAYDDYMIPYDITVTIPAGQTTANFSFTVFDDANLEADETVVIKLDSATGPFTLKDQSVTGTILNDDGPKLSINDVSVNEGDSGTKLMTFTVTLSEVSLVPVTFKYSTANGTAVDGADYTAAVNVAQSIPAGQLSRTFSIVIKGETVVEPLETLYVNLANVTGGALGDAQGIGYIINNDGALIYINDVAVGEGASGTKVMTFTVSLSQVAPGPVTYRISSLNATAVAPTDYVEFDLANQAIPQGQLSKTHTVTINGDATVEDTEVFFVNVRQPTGASVWDGQGIGYILNDDGPTLSVPDASVAEGASGTKVMTFTVALSQVAGVPVTFSVATNNTSATAGSDYVALNLTNQTIPAGQLTKTFQVSVNGDTAVEANESFTFTLGNPTGATLYDRQAIGFIYNDDGPTLSINDVSLSEGNSGTKVATFTATLSQAAAVPISYTVATSNGTATAGSDYVAKSLSGETIPAGQLTRSFTVTLNGDTTVEANETFRATLSNISAGATLFKNIGTGTITNDD